jgi:hypothetical protein
MSSFQRTILAAALLWTPAAAEAATPSLAANGLRSTARTIEVGGAVRIEGLRDRDAARAETFVGERFEVFSPDARVVVVGESGPTELAPPENVYFKGALEGIPGSRVLISVLADGRVRGVATDWGSAALLLTGADGALEVRRVDPARSKRRPFACDQAALDAGLSRPDLPPIQLGAIPQPDSFNPPPARTARIAIDSDFEFYQLFGNVQDATNYVADLFGFMSLVYEAEVGTSIRIPYLRFWTTAADPWTESASICTLFQFSKHWNDTQDAVSRTIAHMVSGKPSGGGVAWRQVLCAGDLSFNATPYGCGSGITGTSNWAGGYGYTGDMDGNFLDESPGALWDIIATTHEIGHNFSSKHTHCYSGNGGNPSHVDRCYVQESGGGSDTCNAGTGNWNATGCACNPGGAPAVLPGAGSTSGGTPGAGNGTIMSYCHLLGGGYPNIDYTMGQGHPFGVAPDRVPAQMVSHAVAMAGSNPACLAYVPGSSVIFRHGFDAGSTGGWSAFVP